MVGVLWCSVQQHLQELWYWGPRALEVQRIHEPWVMEQWKLELELRMLEPEAPQYALLEVAAPL